MANEKRLIDANELIRIVRSHANKDPVSYPIVSATLNAVANLADSLEIVDAVEVVRCKDCKYWECWRNSGEGSGDCLSDEGYQTLTTQHYDFCSYGERREGE